MLNTVKEIIYTVGDSTGSFARSIGLSSRDIAKSLGTGTVRIAKDIGPRRALIGAALVGVAVVGGIALVRYFRRREQERYEEESMQASDELGGTGRTRSSRMSRAERRAVNAAQSMGR